MIIQDGDVHEPGIRLRTLCALLRVLAGRRGHARLRWWSAGFTYELAVARTEQVEVELDDDETAEDRELARAHIWEVFGP